MAVRDVKVCLLGESGVGKSSLMQRFVHDNFRHNTDSTIGASFMTKNLEVNGVTYKFQIWDTAGQEKYKALAPMYYRGSAAAVIVYDITSESSFRTLKMWVTELQRHGPANIVVAVAGNKSDLEDLREVPTDEAASYSENMGAVFFETSAKTAKNVGQIFVQLSQLLPQEESNDHHALSNIRVKTNANKTAKKKCC